MLKWQMLEWHIAKLTNIKVTDTKVTDVKVSSKIYVTLTSVTLTSVTYFTWHFEDIKVSSKICQCYIHICHILLDTLTSDKCKSQRDVKVIDV